MKITNKEKYFDYKKQLETKKEVEFYQNKFSPILAEIDHKIASKKELNFLHSGHLGDIIYALPIIKHLSKTHKCNLYIQANKPIDTYFHKHIAGNVFLNEKLVSMILPLLKTQKYISKVEKYNNELIDIDFDLFRKMPVQLSWLSLRWYFHLTGQFADIENPYLEVGENIKYKDKIVIVRSFRARNPFIDYTFLSQYSNLLFIGLEEEYKDLSLQIPNMEYYNPKDFLEMATIINSCQLFIGNQSFAFAIAEALKVNRLLEAYPEFPVVHPIGKNGKDFYFQLHFEKFVNEFLAR